MGVYTVTQAVLFKVFMTTDNVVLDDLTGRVVWLSFVPMGGFLGLGSLEDGYRAVLLLDLVW